MNEHVIKGKQSEREFEALLKVCIINANIFVYFDDKIIISFLFDLLNLLPAVCKILRPASQPPTMYVQSLFLLLPGARFELQQVFNPQMC